MATFDRERVREAFGLLGEDLARRGLFVEIAVYGGIAIMLQFDWRRGTEDVDALVRSGFDEALLAPSVQAVAERMNLPGNWLNDAVGMFTPLREPEGLFEHGGTYPPGAKPGLRAFLASPAYLLALKLGALASPDRGDRDLRDARSLAQHLGMASEDELAALYESVFDEEPARTARARFAAVLGG